MEPRIRKVEEWISNIAQGNIKLPRFQRDESWSHAQIVGLFENILRKPSLPVGTLLTLEVGDEEIFTSRSIASLHDDGTKPSMHLLDGQQRMTALWRSLNNGYTNMNFFVCLDNETEDNETENQEEGADRVFIHKERRWSGRNGAKMPIWADDPAKQFERGLIALDCFRPGNEGEKRLNEWMAAVEKDSEWDLREYLQRIYELRARIAGYVIPFLQLPSSTSRETALDVFIKMNTSASPLRAYDIVVAQLEAEAGKSLRELVKQLLEEVPEAKNYGKIQDIILSVAALVSGRPPRKTTYLGPDFGRSLSENWEKVLQGIRRGIEFLRQEAIFNEKCLPSDVAVYLICALWAEVPDGEDEEGNDRTLLRKVLWRACYTERYGKTSASRSFADYKAIKACMLNKRDEKTVELFDKGEYPLPSEDQLIEAGWPSRPDRLPKAILATTLRAGGHDFADGRPASTESLAGREYHHLFPVAVLGGDRASKDSNRALNCAQISWRTNRKIAAKTPEEYIRMRVEASKVGEDEVRERLKTHLISYDKLIAGDYDEFLRARARKVARHMRQLCKGRDPRLRRG